LTFRASVSILPAVKTSYDIHPERPEHSGTAVNLYGEGMLDSLRRILEPRFGAGPFLIVTDGRIWKAVAPRLSAFLDEAPGATVHILPADPPPYASGELVDRMEGLIAATGAVPIAVGSGTINDVVKLASFRNGRGYVCIPTAPSVDGYTSMGSAITVGGFKITVDCPPPECVVADESVIVRAPPAMISAGYGDLVAKLAAGADWMIADMMGVEAIDPAAWKLAQSAAVKLLPLGEAVGRGERESIGILYRGLVDSGLAIQVYDDSRPASGAEHFLSHTWEMSHLAKDGAEVSHGFKVAIGTLIAAALMNEIFGDNGAAGALARRRNFSPASDLLASRLAWARLIPEDSPHRQKTIEAIREKTPDAAGIAGRADWACGCWEELSAKIRNQLPSVEVLARALGQAGCPVEPAQIGLTRQACMDGVRVASLIRKRYTVLDLASELGILDAAIEAVFSGKYFRDYA
jgi:glycerol-1-phosphate dehydrogenase [NAD(P)+]